MPKDQRTFTQEFRQEAVRLVQTSGKSITQVARDLGIADSTLPHWCKLVPEQGEQAFLAVDIRPRWKRRAVVSQEYQSPVQFEQQNT